MVRLYYISTVNPISFDIFYNKEEIANDKHVSVES